LKLHEHVAILKSAIENAYDKEFSRLGFGKNKAISIEHIPSGNQMRRQRFEGMLESHIGETGDYEHAREKLVDELTFTLFNRLAAVKVMEAANLFPPIITKRAEHGGRSFGHKAWLETNPHQRDEELEGLRAYIKAAFDKIGASLPLFSSEYPFSLFPDTISLNEIIDLYNGVELDTKIEPEIWGSDDVLGWCYESYNNSKKKELKDSGQKIEYNYVSLQSQWYTPRQVVQFLVDNSLGKCYLEMFPDSRIKHQFKIANAPTTRIRELKPLHQVRIIDPACGSGNFLLYAFDLFYALYLDQIENYGADYTETDIPQLIIENNLHGIDLDDRAVQVAHLGLFIKASSKNRSMGEFNYRIVSSDFYLPDYKEVAHVFEANSNLGKQQKELIAEIWEDLQYAYKFGSLIRLKEKVERRLQSLFGQQVTQNPSLFSGKDIGVQPQAVQSDAFFEQDVANEREFIQSFFANLRTAVDQFARTEKNSFMATKTQDAITFLELLTSEYDVATANPPYTDSSDFGPELKTFIETNYKKPFKFHTNLYATFIKRCYDFTGLSGLVAMVHPPTFMYIKTFEDVRKFMIDKTHINIFVEWGYLGMFNPAARVDSALYILEKNSNQEKDAVFIKLNDLYETKRYDALFEAFDSYLAGGVHELLYTIPQSKLKIIKSRPFIYWISDEFREKFKKDSVKDLLKNCQGLATANNNRFLRFWWELSPTDKKIDNDSWVYYAKGGPYKKWSGNLWLMVNWKLDGHEIKKYTDDKGKQKSRPQNEAVYFKQGITYSASGSKGPSYRLLPEGCIFDVGGSSIFPINKYRNNSYILAFFNSTFSKYVIECLNPTVNKQVGDVERVPFAIPSEKLEAVIETLSNMNVSITTHIRSTELFDGIFTESSLVLSRNGDWKVTIHNSLHIENHLLTQVLINEAIINEKIFEVYDLTDHDKVMVIAKEGESIGGLPVSPEARDAYLAETEATKEFSLDAICDFIEELANKEFTAEEREPIEGGFPNLYQSNNDLEEFCIRHQVNPINVWYWFKKSDVIPQQRMHTLAMEFLVDLVREILMEDEDGIIPLVANAGEKILVDRIEEKFNAKGFSSAQYSNFDSVLGRPISEYLNNHFFAELSDHLNLFMYLPKTPFIWQLSSGPEQGFDCYIIIYKWSRDNLMRLRSVYIEHRERALINRQADLVENESASAQNEKDIIFRQLHEVESFKSKIDELLAEGYNPILDDGVGKNIAPLQKKGMIPYDVLNPGQLKKYLNADW
jgi:type I restriction-modification system DNA methylase subunit